MAASRNEPDSASASPERWQRIKSVLSVALETDPGERPSYLDWACADDLSLRSEIEKLLAIEEQSQRTLLEGPFAAALDDDTNARLGQRVGPYRLVEEIGVGGMGEVYRAFRDDDQYKKEVAIKLVRAGQDSRFVIARFKHERQVLASLDHPNIARLLDGGTTDDGIPYFVMELIEGQPLTKYCDEHRLVITDRLKLFLAVCSAVEYAHQHLIIHRDLKPSNILVTAERTPKLLDFGIAKILDPAASLQSAAATKSMFRMLTPAYASPEQIKDEAITTASDVYSLGVVLYECLTGHPPYSNCAGSPHETSRAVCEVEPEKPSTVVRRTEARIAHDQTFDITPISVSATREGTPEKLAKRLRGDLDNIVLMALRKEPQRRYASVEQFAGDVRRHLESLPVTATGDSLRYRTKKFVARHTTGVAAAIALFLVVLAGISATLYEAHRARFNELRAEKRFNDVRTLANSLIFDIHDSIQNLPGSTPARKTLLEQAVRYLDSLSKESRGDVSLERELATAYQRIGLLQGNGLDANLGQTEAAIASLRKSLALFDSVASANPRNITDQLNLAHACRVLSSVLGNTGKPDAREQVDRALAITAALLRDNSANQDVLSERAGEFDLLAGFQADSGDAPGAEDSLRRGLSIAEDRLRADPGSRKAQGAIAVGRVRLGNVLAQEGLRSQALELNRSGLDLFESLARDQNDARIRRQLAVATGFRGMIQIMNGNLGQALATFEHSHARLQPLLTADPENVLYRMDTAGYHADVGNVLTLLGRPKQGLTELDHALQALEQQRMQDAAYTDIPYWLGQVHIWRGEAFSRLGDNGASLAEYRQGATSFETVTKQTVGNLTRCDLAASYNKLGGALIAARNQTEARAYYVKALSIAEPLALKTPPSVLALYVVADAYAGMGTLAGGSSPVLGAVSSAQPPFSNERCTWFRKSREAWQKIPNPSRISPSSYGTQGFEVGDPELVRKQLRTCEAMSPNLGHAAN